MKNYIIAILIILSGCIKKDYYGTADFKVISKDSVAYKKGLSEGMAIGRKEAIKMCMEEIDKYYLFPKKDSL